MSINAVNVNYSFQTVDSRIYNYSQPNQCIVAVVADYTLKMQQYVVMHNNVSMDDISQLMCLHQPKCIEINI